MKSKRKLMYGLLPILFAGGIGMYLYMQNNKEAEAKPQTTVNQYIEHLQKKEFDQLYTLMTPASLQESGMNKEQFVEKYNAIYSGMEVSTVKAEVKPVDVDETASDGSKTDAEKQNPDTYEVDYNLQLTTFLGEVSETHTLKLVRQELEDGGKNWKINWQPSLILNDMVKGSKVRVRTLFPDRGDIVDRDGLPLATKGTMNEWGIVPGNLVITRTR